jgi:hypothetical protein
MDTDRSERADSMQTPAQQLAAARRINAALQPLLAYESLVKSAISGNHILTEVERLWLVEQQKRFGWPRAMTPEQMKRVRGLVAEWSDEFAAEKPKKLLTNWREITDALGLNHDDQDKVKSLNERFSGPIPKPPQGGQPIVSHDVLVKWWNGLAVQQQEAANQRDGAKLAVESQHAYGKRRPVQVAPEIGGSVKRRRADRKR